MSQTLETAFANELRALAAESAGTHFPGLSPPVCDDSPHQLYFTPDGLPPKPLTPEETFEKERRHERETLRVLFARNGLQLPDFIEKEPLDRPSPSWDLGRGDRIVDYHRALRDSETTGITSLLTSPYYCVEDLRPPSEEPACGIASPPCSSTNSLGTKDHLNIQFDGSKLASAYPSDPESFRRQRLQERESLRHSLAKQGFPLPEMIEQEDLSQPSHLWSPGRVEAIARYHREIRDSKTTVLLSSPYYSYDIPTPQTLPNTQKRVSDSPPPDAKRRRTETTFPRHEEENLLWDNTNPKSTGKEVHQITQATFKVPTAPEIGREVRRGKANSTTRKRNEKETLKNRRSANAAAQCEAPEDHPLFSTADVSAVEHQAQELEEHSTLGEEPDSLGAENNAMTDAHATTPHDDMSPSISNERLEFFRAPYDHVVGFPPERPAEAEQNKIDASWPGPYRGHSSIVGAYDTLQEDSHDNATLEPEANLDEDKHELKEIEDSSKNIQSPLDLIWEEETEEEEWYHSSWPQDHCVDDEADTSTISTSDYYNKSYSQWEVVEIVTASLDVDTSAQQYEVEFPHEDRSPASSTEEKTPAPEECPTYPAADEIPANNSSEMRSTMKSGKKDREYEAFRKGVQKSRIQKASLRHRKNMKGNTLLKSSRLERACAI